MLSGGGNVGTWSGSRWGLEVMFSWLECRKKLQWFDREEKGREDLLQLFRDEDGGTGCSQI